MTFKTETQANDFRARIAGLNTNPIVVVQTTHGHWAVTSAVEAMRPAKICSICEQPFREFSNNAEPINDGRCCAYCDDYVVTPARIRKAEGGAA